MLAPCLATNQEKISMKKQRKSRLVFVFNDRALLRLRLEERARNGKFTPIERPWAQKDLAGLKRCAKATRLMASGNADLDEVLGTANAARQTRRRKQTPAKEGGGPAGDGGVAGGSLTDVDLNDRNGDVDERGW
jgi:hypothetical protein